MKLFKRKTKDEGTHSGFHVDCSCGCVHTRNGEIVKPDSKITIIIKNIINRLRG